MIYCIVFIAGACVMVLELVGARLIAPFYGGTIFVWSSMIGVTLSALACGYYAGGAVADKCSRGCVLHLILFWAGVFIAVLTLIDERVLIWSEPLGFKYGPLVAALILFFVPLFLLGMVSPFAVRIGSRSGVLAGRFLGKVLALGTVGSIVGVLLTGFVFIPQYSLIVILAAAAAVLLFVGSGGWYGSGWIARFMMFVGAVIAVGCIVFSWQRPLPEGSAIIDRSRSFYGDFKIVRNGPYQCLYVNASAQSCLKSDGTTDSRYVRGIGRVVEQLQPRRVLVLGLAGGMVLKLFGPEVEVHAVDFDPAVVALARKNGMIPREPDKLFFDDARRFLRQTRERYDLVVVDIAQGNYIPGYLFSYEAFQSMENILSEDGVVFVHLSLNADNPDDPFLSLLTNTFASVFGDHIEIYFNDNPIQDINLLAGNISGLDVSPYRQGKVLDLSKAGIVTDRYNPLDRLYLPHALVFHKAARMIGKDIMLSGR